jgi:predicted porin
MKKIAIAVATAMTAATASAMDFTLYGIVDTGLGYTHVNTLDEPTENRFEEINGYNSGSRFGFKGTEDLGNGYSVSFVLENGFSSDSGALGQGGRMFGREAQLKFHSPYGTLSFGRAGTLISGAGTLDIWGVNADVLPGGWDGIFNIGNYQGNGMRLDNMVTYRTPTAAGFTGYLQYSFANDTTDGDDDSKPNERSSNRYFAGGLTYNNGPLGVVVIYDTLMFRHYGVDTSDNDHPKDPNVGDSRVLSVGGHYDFGSFKLTAFGQYVKGARSGFGDGLGYSVPFWSDDDSLIPTYYYDADGYNFHIGAQIPMDSWGRLYLGAYYGYLEANDDYRNSEAKNINLLVGHEYDFSKRTTLYSGVAYKQLKNENDDGKLGDMKATQVIVGLRHIF